MTRNVIALARREMISIFCSPLAWAVLALFLGFTGFFFILFAATTMLASMSGTFQIIKFISLFAVPLITMRLLSEEYRSGAIESLMTSPVTDAAVVLGKFIGAMAFYLFMLAPTLIYVVILQRWGGVDLGPVVSGYVGLILTGAMFIALGLLCSSLTQHQVVSGAAAMIALLMLWVVGAAAPYAGPDAGPLMEYAASESHLSAFAGGRLPLRDAFYFLSFAAFFLFLAVRALESRRWRAAGAPGSAATLWNKLTRGAILAGVVCMLAGLAARQVLSSGRFSQAPVLGPILAGAALTAMGMLLNLRWIWSILRGRRFLAGLNVWVSVVLSVIVLMVANAIIAATPQTDAWFLDMTSQRVHTLSEKSRNILKGLDRRVTIVAMCGTGEVSAGYGRLGVDVTRRLKDLMRLYKARGVETRWVDIYADKLEAQRVALELKAQPEPDVLFVAAGDQNVKIPFAALFETERAFGTVPMIGAFQGEEKITSAILSLVERKRTVVYFLTGHGELGPSGEKAKSLGEFAADMKRDNMQVETLNLMQAGKIPEDCGLLVIAGPEAGFKPEENERLEKYLDGGGKILLAVKPRAAHGSSAGLGGLMLMHNFMVGDEEVVIEVGQDLRSGAQAGGISFYTTFQTGHPITRDLGALNCYVTTACPVYGLPADPLPAPGVPPALRPDWEVTPLLMTSPQGWAERNIAAKPVTFDKSVDRAGPVTLAVAVSRKPRAAMPNAPASASSATEGGRMVALGTPTILDDGVFEANQANRTFAMNCVNWLVERETHLGIPPQRSEARQLAVSPAAFRAVFLLTVLGMPLAAGIAGVFVWWVRRR